MTELLDCIRLNDNESNYDAVDDDDDDEDDG